MSYETRLAEFKEMIRKTEYLKYTLNSLIYWDKLTHMPPKGLEYRSAVMGFLADQQYQLMSGSQFRGHVRYFTDHRRNDEITEAMMKRISRSTQYVSKIPEAEYKAYIELIAHAEQVWEKAKQDNNFAVFCPYLQKIFSTFRQFAAYWGYEEDPYDALLDYYEEGLTVRRVDEIADQIKPFLVDLLAEIRNKQKTPTFLSLPAVDEQRQKQLWKMVLTTIGFDFAAGRVDIGSHPTILASSPSDVRIVNAFREDDVRAGLFNVLHSGGKGIYQQSIDPALLGTFLAEVPSFAMEECIGRFYENILGRSQGFWSALYEPLCDVVPALKDYPMQALYTDVNLASPSLIRIEADQFTFLLHIIIRYELERELINGRLDVDELPAAWNEKYENYLGIRPEHDRDGVLQDIHWAAGYVGYFPTYLIADLAAAQLRAAMTRDCGDLDTVMSTGQFAVIHDWLKEKIFCHGAILPTAKLLEQATGAPLRADDYMDYLRKKYSEVYKL